MSMSTRPHGLHAPMRTVTERDPTVVLGDQAREMAAGSVAWAPACTERQLAQYRLELELDREARNLLAHPAPLRAPGGAA